MFDMLFPSGVSIEGSAVRGIEDSIGEAFKPVLCNSVALRNFLTVDKMYHLCVRNSVWEDVSIITSQPRI